MTKLRKAAILDDFATEIIDCEHRTIPVGDGYAYSVGTKAMKDGRIVFEACKRVSQSDYESWTRRGKPEPGDLILAREAPVGQVVRVPFTPRVCLGQRTVLIRPDNDVINPRYLHYWLLGPVAQQAMGGQSGGSTVAHLNVEDIRALDVSTVTSERRVQDQVARVLGAIDDLIENNRRRVALLEQMARQIYQEWFVRYRFPGYKCATFVDSPLGPIPDGWRVTTCGEALSFIGGGTPSKAKPEFWADGTIPWFTPTDLTKGQTRYVSTSATLINKTGLKGSSAKEFPAGSVLMTSRATLGVLAIATEPATTNQGFIIFLPDDRWPPSFMYEWLADQAVGLEALGTGSTFKEITKGALKEYPFVVPVQHVLDAYRNVAESLEHSIHALEGSITQLTGLRDLLLPRLVTGQIDVSRLDITDQT
jgi:type I restriction enzyme S subunit